MDARDAEAIEGLIMLSDVLAGQRMLEEALGLEARAEKLGESGQGMDGYVAWRMRCRAHRLRNEFRRLARIYGFSPGGRDEAKVTE